MQRRWISRSAFAAAAVLGAIGLAQLLESPAADGARAPATPAVSAGPREAPRPSPEPEAVPLLRGTRPPRAPQEMRPASTDEASRRASEPSPDARDEDFWRYTADIEDFKRELYALEIDSIDEIPKLDALVHVDVEDPHELWDTDWTGADDWKRYRDGFSLEHGPDGTLLFLPGEETQRMFTFFEGINLYEWDESQQAFVNRVDYYGKPIFNVVKFLREDVLVMMTISGHKVDTNLFQQGDYR